MEIDERKLTSEALCDYAEFTESLQDRGCTCFQCAPCSYCTHPGNPNNLNEDPTAWRKGTMKLSNINEIQNIQRMAAEINEGISNYTRCKEDERNGTIMISATGRNGQHRPVAANKEKEQAPSLVLDDTELELLDWIVMRAKARHESELNDQLESLGVDSKINLLTGEIEEAE